MLWTLPPPPAIERPAQASASSVPHHRLTRADVVAAGRARRAAQDELTVSLPWAIMNQPTEVGEALTETRNALLGSPRTLTAEQYEARKRRHIELAMLKASGGLNPAQGRELAMLRFELEQHNKSVDAGREVRERQVVVHATRRHAELADAIKQVLASLDMAGKSKQRRHRRS